jgi:hypothetical protein
MLIEIDHIAISSIRFAEHIKIMKTIGYAPTFIETNIDNLQIKRQLLNRYDAKHDLALLNSVGNIGIELVNHRYIHESDAYIVPIFENIPYELIEDIKEKKINNIGFCAKMKAFDIPIYISDSDSPNLQFKKFVVKTKNIKKSILFWELLGFKVIQTTPDLVFLEFRALLHKNIYHLYLQKNNDDNIIHCLDDRGFNCIAFISNSAKNEKEFLDKKDVSTTNIEKFVLGEKTLDIFFAKGPSGELIEIISIHNN